MLGFEQFPDYQVPGFVKHDFNPYESNGGSVVAIAGDDYVVVAADTRLSSGYSIHSRNQNKLFKLTDRTVLASTGCWPDTLALTSLIKVRIQMYKDNHGREMSTAAIAQMVSNLMYNRRFFPYYVSNILAGLDTEGRGIIYSYDPIGHCASTMYRAGGSSGALLQPILDNQIGYKNMTEETVKRVPISLEKAIQVTKDTFISAAERDIYTGDSVMLNIITGSGIAVQQIDLRRD